MVKKLSLIFLCLLSIMLCVSCGGSGSKDNSTDQSREVESLILHLEKEKSAYYGMTEKKYNLEYKITLHMDGEAEIYVSPTKYLSPISCEFCDNHDEMNVRGSWTLREKKRGADYVEYYDIEFTENYDEHNWCVDKDCKILYFNWNAFKTNDRTKALDVARVETIYVD